MFKKSSRVLIVTLLLFVLAGSTYAFAASNTVPSSLAGDGSGDIDGYVVSEISYLTSGGELTGVSFELNEDATTVQAAIGTGETVTYTFSDLCVLKSGKWSCSFTDSIPVYDAIELRVIAVQ